MFIVANTVDDAAMGITHVIQVARSIINVTPEENAVVRDTLRDTPNGRPSRTCRSL